MHQQEVVNTGEYYWSCLNRSQNSQGTLWLLASSFSDPALACRTLRVSTASVSTLILKSSSQKQLTWQAREALAFKSFIDSLRFKEKMTIIPKEIFQTNMLRASTWNISSVLIWEMWWRWWLMALGPLESASHLPADIVSLKKVSAAPGSMMFIGISCVMHTSFHVHNISQRWQFRTALPFCRQFAC